MKQKKYILSRIFAGLITGIFAGLTICLFRLFMNFCDNALNHKIIPALHSGSLLYSAAWGAGLLLLSRFVYWSICLEPKAEGGGVSHFLEEARGVTDARWWSVLLVKLTSAPLCILAGFSLGKTGSAVEIGTMSGKGVCRLNTIAPAPERGCLHYFAPRCPVLPSPLKNFQDAEPYLH